MRKVSIFVGVALFALASAARAQEAAPAPPSAPATDTPPVAAEPPAKAQEAAPAPATGMPPAAAEPALVAEAAPRATGTERKLQVGVLFLPMALGTFPAPPNSPSPRVDAAFAYGLGLSAGYMVLPGLIAGIAPQVIYNVKGKEDAEAAKEVDLMVRIAYSYQLAANTSVYAEVLPGYSVILSSGDPAKGLVVAVGAGGAIDLTDRFFASLGVGYQMGFQKQNLGKATIDVKTKYLRLALGGGVKF